MMPLQIGCARAKKCGKLIPSKSWHKKSANRYLEHQQILQNRRIGKPGKISGKLNCLKGRRSVPDKKAWKLQWLANRSAGGPAKNTETHTFDQALSTKCFDEHFWTPILRRPTLTIKTHFGTSIWPLSDGSDNKNVGGLD